MVIVMKRNATPEQVDETVQHVEALGFKAHLVTGEERSIIGLIGDDRPLEPERLELLPGVERVLRVLHPFKLASRDAHPEDSIVRLNGHSLGGNQVIVMAGPAPSSRASS